MEVNGGRRTCFSEPYYIVCGTPDGLAVKSSMGYTRYQSGRRVNVDEADLG